MASITAYISLGGNMGREESLFAEALSHLAVCSKATVSGTSRYYRTQPQGDAAQPWFINQVAALSCDSLVTPCCALLETMLALETRLGRSRNPDRHYGPRCIDLDLLLYGGMVSTDPQAIVPHPRMTERAFVLVPLLELAPDLTMPDGISVAWYLSRLAHTVEGDRIFQ